MNLSESPSNHSQHGLFGSLETLTRCEQHDKSKTPKQIKRLNGPMVLLSFATFTLAGIALFALVTVFVMKSVLVPEVGQSNEPLSSSFVQSEVITGEDILEEEFQNVKGKLHSFFTIAAAGKAKQPIRLGEREVNAFLKHDLRLGKLRNTASITINNSRVQTFFDVNLGDAKFFGNEPMGVRGTGSFRLGMQKGQLQVAVDSLRVNHKDMHRWMNRIHNSSVRQMATTGLKRIANIPLGWLGKGMKLSRSSKAVKAYLTFSKDTTGDMFESISYQGNGILNVIAEPFQAAALNRLFKVHSRLHDLVLSLDRVEVSDGYIILYPRVTS